jgi:hypothetical protein
MKNTDDYYRIVSVVLHHISLTWAVIIRKEVKYYESFGLVKIAIGHIYHWIFNEYPHQLKHILVANDTRIKVTDIIEELEPSIGYSDVNRYRDIKDRFGVIHVLQCAACFGGTTYDPFGESANSSALAVSNSVCAANRAACALDEHEQIAHSKRIAVFFEENVKPIFADDDFPSSWNIHFAMEDKETKFLIEIEIPAAAALWRAALLDACAVINKKEILSQPLWIEAAPKLTFLCCSELKKYFSANEKFTPWFILYDELANAQDGREQLQHQLSRMPEELWEKGFEEISLYLSSKFQRS